MTAEFASKLRLTAKVLGCRRHKEICARFRAANNETHCTVERLNKWLQGRALPRATEFYEDWAKVLGTAKSGTWLSSCTVSAFADEIASLFQVDARQLLASQPLSDRLAGAPMRLPNHSYLEGSFACYSRAWSPYDAGMLIRGTLDLRPRRGGNFAATYTESVLTGQISFSGVAQAGGRTLNLQAEEPMTLAQISMCLFLPNPPGSALSGFLTGATFSGQEALPSTGRIVVLRLPEGAPAVATNGYLRAVPGAVTADLARLGLLLTDAGWTDTLVLEMLLNGTSEPGRDKMPLDAQTRLVAALDNVRSAHAAP